jgi:hypothetical protein
MKVTQVGIRPSEAAQKAGRLRFDRRLEFEADGLKDRDIEETEETFPCI